MLLDRQDLPTPASLERSGAIILVVQKILQRSEEKCAEPTLLAIRVAQCVLLEQMSEKTLDQVLRISGGMTAVAKETVKRRPIGFAKSGKRLVRGGLRFGFPGTKHYGPMRRLKRSTAFLQSSRDCLRGDRASPTRLDLARIKSHGGSVVPADRLFTGGMQAPRLPLQCQFHRDTLPLSKRRERPTRLRRAGSS